MGSICFAAEPSQNIEEESNSVSLNIELKKLEYEAGLLNESYLNLDQAYLNAKDLEFYITEDEEEDATYLYDTAKVSIKKKSNYSQI